jgi:hypothetical protein
MPIHKLIATSGSEPILNFSSTCVDFICGGLVSGKLRKLKFNEKW